MIAAVNGFAIGVGVTLLLHCDLVYLAQGARLQLPFVNIGICPEFASTYLLPRFMGPARAAELVMFGEPFSAAQALEHGLATAVLADAEVERHALERARKLAQQPPHALRVTKQLMRKWPLETVAEAIREEAVHFIAMLKGPEAREAMTAFMQKRKPDFTPVQMSPDLKRRAEGISCAAPGPAGAGLRAGFDRRAGHRRLRPGWPPGPARRAGRADPELSATEAETAAGRGGAAGAYLGESAAILRAILEGR